MHHRGWVFLIVTLALLALGACSGGSSSSSTTPSSQDSAPSLAELQAGLQAEFDRLGIDPDKVTAKAPQKEENAVFDFAGELDDPDGDGGDPPTGITLTWTERLIADYNQDGMVTANDLTPIGQNYCFDTETPQVTYDDPGDHNGIEYWPAGDPDDGADGSLNWRLAVVDGNNDGRILMHDITPIAVHYEERLTGYRIWRKAPGGSFEIVPNPEDAGCDVTIPRPSSSSATAPVRYSFTDTDATATGLGEGAYAYYVQPWDGSTSTGGPVSAVAVIDNTGTTIPEQPVAQLTVTPDFGGAPVVITLDASGSTDSDGTVDVWHWDFDADGLTDWVSTDVVPEASTAGTVDTITPVSDGVVTVTYRQGNAQWFFPSVIVEDNDGLTSQPVYDQLGVSGWVTELITHREDPNYQFDPYNITVDPANGQVVVYGDSWTDHGYYIAWREGVENWRVEQVIDVETHEYFQDQLDPSVWGAIGWNTDNSPVFFLNMSRGIMPPKTHQYIAQRGSDGTWVNQVAYEWDENVSNGAFSDIIQTSPGQYVISAGENFSTVPNASGYRVHIFEYMNNVMNLTDTILEQDGTNDILDAYEYLSVIGESTPVFSSFLYDKDTTEYLLDLTKISFNNQVSPGDWNRIELPPSTWGLDSYLYLNGIFRDPNGEIHLLARQHAQDDTNSAVLGWYILDYPNSDALQVWSPEDEPLFETYDGFRKFFPVIGSFNWINYLDIDYAESIGLRSRDTYLRYEDSLKITETIYEVQNSPLAKRASVRNGFVSEDGNQAYVIIVGDNLEGVPHDGPSSNRGFLLGTRVDPRY